MSNSKLQTVMFEALPNLGAVLGSPRRACWKLIMSNMMHLSISQRDFPTLFFPLLCSSEQLLPLRSDVHFKYM